MIENINRYKIRTDYRLPDKSRIINSIRSIYERSFPEDERRDFADLAELTNTEPAFRIDIFTDENAESIGFISYWIFSDFVYVEHFAVDENKRGKGYGKFILEKLVNLSSLPLILEVEPPEDETSIRRIRFYENMGFILSKIPYLQPAYGPDKKSVPLLLMSKGNIDLNNCHDQVKETLFREVYKV